MRIRLDHHAHRGRRTFLVEATLSAVTLSAMTLSAVAVAGCTRAPSAQDAATHLAQALASGDVGTLAGPAAQHDLQVVTSGMDTARPRVEVVGVHDRGDLADVTLRWSWPMDGGTWTYDATGSMARHADRWAPTWSPTLVNPSVTASTRLVHTRTWLRRADITGTDGEALMTWRPVLRVGLDKASVPPARWAGSATALAGALGIDAAGFRARVAAAGPQAFVEAITLRGSDAADAPDTSRIPGATVLHDQAVLGPSRAFAAGVLGAVGPATAEQVSASRGRLGAGAVTGQSGLEARYDQQLAGSPGDRVDLRDRTGPVTRQTLYSTQPVAGTPLHTTIQLEAQQHAETILAGQKTPSALVAIDPATGHVLVAATGGANQFTPDATTGRYAPGSTFKAVTALALLRSGMTPDSQVDCSSTVTVDGRRFKNYNDFPAARVGRMTLREAVALSCNTALIAEHDRVTGASLREAAASLGLGQDMDAGLPVFFGSVPDPLNVVGLAESMIGQGLVEASPLAMATIAASIQAGHTVRPVLLPDHAAAPPSGPPLTAIEAAQLRDLMHAVITDGSGRMLAGLADGAKTGTAEYGTATPPRTHAWMIAYTAHLAVAVMVFDGDSGSGSAGPLLKAFLQ